MLRIFVAFLKKSDAKNFQTMGFILFFNLCVDWLLSIWCYITIASLKREANIYDTFG